MTAIVTAATPSLPETPIVPNDLPSPSGLILYDRAAIETQVRSGGVEVSSVIVGFVWGQTSNYGGDIPGVVIGPIAFDGEHLRFVEASGEHAGSLHGWPYGESPPEGDHFPADVQALRATWLLMAQKLAATEVERPARAERRRCERAGVPATVNVVRVRKREQRPTDGSRDVEWSHRWLVAGHWRRQWCPSVGAHRPTWIAGHVKGPAEKPLVVKDRVTTWVR